jgi:sulfur carrier protein ThiS
MSHIIFNAFSFLQKKCRQNQVSYEDAALEIPDGTRVRELIRRLNLEEKDVEAVFINGKVVSKDTIIKERDRVAFIPPGTPGPYRVLLGFYNEP